MVIKKLVKKKNIFFSFAQKYQQNLINQSEQKY